MVSVRSLTATHSMSAPCAWAARNTLRPIRPKPLIPTRTGMESVSPLVSGPGKAEHVSSVRPGDDLDPQAVGVEQVGGVVARAVLRPRARARRRRDPPPARPAAWAASTAARPDAAQRDVAEAGRRRAAARDDPEPRLVRARRRSRPGRRRRAARRGGRARRRRTRPSARGRRPRSRRGRARTWQYASARRQVDVAVGDLDEQVVALAVARARGARRSRPSGGGRRCSRSRSSGAPCPRRRTAAAGSPAARRGARRTRRACRRARRSSTTRASWPVSGRSSAS